MIEVLLGSVGWLSDENDVAGVENATTFIENCLEMADDG